MANQYPDFYPSKYAGDAGDFLIAKIDRSGAVRHEANAVTVDASSTVGTVIGLAPFRKGATLNYGGTSIYTTDASTGAITYNVGYTYESTAETSDADAFASLSTAGQAGGFVVLDEDEGLTWEATNDGWITVTVAGAAVSTAGATITGQVALAYDK